MGAKFKEEELRKVEAEILKLMRTHAGEETTRLIEEKIKEVIENKIRG